MNCDYSGYEGWEVTGKTELVLLLLYLPGTMSTDISTREMDLMYLQII